MRPVLEVLDEYIDMLTSQRQFDILVEKETRPLGAAGLKKEFNVLYEEIGKTNDNGNATVSISVAPTQREIIKFNGWIKRGCQAKRHSKNRLWVPAEMVTPGMAELMLRRNTHNRPLAQKAVDDYASLIERNLWELTGEQVSFDWDGVLLNGQHRLHAIIASGIPAEIDLLFGSDPKVAKAMDQGKLRSAADIVSLNSFSYGHYRSALARTILELERAPRTKQDVAAKVDQLGSTTDKAVKWAGRLKFMTNPAAISLAYFTIQEGGSPEKDIDRFFESFLNADQLGSVRKKLLYMLTGIHAPKRADTSISPEDSDAKLRRKKRDLHSHILGYGSGREHTHYRAAAIILSWNAYRRERFDVSLHWDKRSELPKPLR